LSTSQSNVKFFQSSQFDLLVLDSRRNLTGQTPQYVLSALYLRISVLYSSKKGWALGWFVVVSKIFVLKTANLIRIFGCERPLDGEEICCATLLGSSTSCSSNGNLNCQSAKLLQVLTLPLLPSRSIIYSEANERHTKEPLHLSETADLLERPSHRNHARH
jgi:hypothetical protein